MYLALFLTPWMLVYALSTLVMNHGIGGAQIIIKEGEQPYATVFEPGTPPRQIAEQILADQHLEGAFTLQGPRADGSLTIVRQGLITPRRLTYTPSDHRLVVERIEWKAPQFLNRFHHRRGFAQPYAADQAMAWSIDLVIVALAFWALSGVWMWWQMRRTRLWGLAAALSGIALFTFFTLAI